MGKGGKKNQRSKKQRQEENPKKVTRDEGDCLQASATNEEFPELVPSMQQEKQGGKKNQRSNKQKQEEKTEKVTRVGEGDCLQASASNEEFPELVPSTQQVKQVEEMDSKGASGSDQLSQENGAKSRNRRRRKKKGNSENTEGETSSTKHVSQKIEQPSGKGDNGISSKVQRKKTDDVVEKPEKNTSTPIDKVTDKLSEVSLTDEKNNSKAAGVQSSQENVTKSTRPQKQLKPLLRAGTTLTQDKQYEKGFTPPARPGFGTIGRRINLESNFYQMSFRDIDIFRYDVTIAEGIKIDKTPKQLNRLIFEQFVNNSTELSFIRPVYDGKKMAFSPKDLRHYENKPFDVTINDQNRDRTFQITLQTAGQVNLQQLRNAIKEGRTNIPHEAIMALDMVLRYKATLNYVPRGTKIFAPKGKFDIGGGREVWRGYHQSVRPSLNGVLLNIDLSAAVFIPDVYVTNYLKDVTNARIENSLRVADRRKFSKEIKNLKVYTTYNETKRKYRVNGLTEFDASKQKFLYEKDGIKGEISVKEYFLKDKNFRLRYPHLPCLHVGNKDRKIYIPMELCRIVEGQLAKGVLNERQSAQMVTRVTEAPEVKFQGIQDTKKNCQFEADPFLTSFGIDVGDKLLTVPARILDPPSIAYGQNKKVTPKTGSGSWNMKNLKLYQGACIKNWALIVYQPMDHKGRPDRNQMDEQKMNNFKMNLYRSAQSYGVMFGECIFQKLYSSNRDTASNVITEIILDQPNVELLVVVLPNQKNHFYDDLKRICETANGNNDIRNPNVKELIKTNGLVTQCIKASNAIKCNPMTIAQLCLKINSKLGGINNVVENGNPMNNFRLERIFDDNEPVLFLGADVNHPPPGNKTTPSIAAVVGSIDQYPSRYAVSIRLQKDRRKEIIEDLREIVKDLLKEFYKKTGKKPGKIIMFRDGVSEGQFKDALVHEMRAIKLACADIPNYDPKVTFVIVQKRNHGKFRSLDKQNVDRSGNCLAGTTVDRVVCHPKEFDFYQFNHAGILGTSKPTKYHIIWDDNKFTPNEMQQLTFMLCHLYVRCTRSVSIPAPAYYAHHAAYRAKLHLTNNDESDASTASSDSGEINPKLLEKLRAIVKPHQNLANRMYYI